jgi:hypothetical protein
VVASWGGELVSSPFCNIACAVGECPAVPLSFPRLGLVMKISLLFRFLMFAVVLVVRGLESPSELSMPMGGLPAPQSSCRGQHR